MSCVIFAVGANWTEGSTYSIGGYFRAWARESGVQVGRARRRDAAAQLGIAGANTSPTNSSSGGNRADVKAKQAAPYFDWIDLAEGALDAIDTMTEELRKSLLAYAERLQRDGLLPSIDHFEQRLPRLPEWASQARPEWIEHLLSLSVLERTPQGIEFSEVGVMVLIVID